MGCKKIDLTNDQKEQIIEKTLSGMTMITICNELDIPRRSIHTMIQRDPLFAKELANARAEYAHDQVEYMRTIYNDCETLTDAQIARGQSENIRWEVSKRVPEVYGDSINLNVKHSVDLSKVLEAAAGRAIPFIEMKQAIEIQAELIQDPPKTEDTE